MTLDDVRPGETCRVRGVLTEGRLGQRLVDLGFCPGVLIKVVRNAPLFDPLELVLGSYEVSIRHAEAKHVEVERQ